VSLLSVVQSVCNELGLIPPSAVAGNSDAQTVQLLALANRAGKELAESSASAGYWPQLRKQFTFTLQSAGPYTGTITPGSNVVTNLSSVAGIGVNWIASANGLLNDSIVTAIGVNSVTLSQLPSATSIQTGVNVTFGQEAYPFPSDLAYFINQTGWDRNFRWQLLGPLDAQEWQVVKSGVSPVGPRLRWRVMNGQIYINPAPYNNDLVVFEYVSNLWVATTGAPTTGAQTSYQADTDVAIISEDLITLYTKWLFLRAKGIDYTEEKKMYQEKYDRTIGRAAMARNLQLNARATGIRLLNSQNVPDTGFGS
jgi:hypothetical protein